MSAGSCSKSICTKALSLSIEALAYPAAADADELREGPGLVGPVALGKALRQPEDDLLLAVPAQVLQGVGLGLADNGMDLGLGRNVGGRERQPAVLAEIGVQKFIADFEAVRAHPWEGDLKCRSLLKRSYPGHRGRQRRRLVVAGGGDERERHAIYLGVLGVEASLRVDGVGTSA